MQSKYKIKYPKSSLLSAVICSNALTLLSSFLSTTPTLKGERFTLAHSLQFLLIGSCNGSQEKGQARKRERMFWVPPTLTTSSHQASLLTATQLKASIIHQRFPLCLLEALRGHLDINQLLNTY